jgi:EAL domain-containing protein (putative c-di-GMP-specific phosphodiesterase class I)
LRHALGRRELLLHYQPRIDLRTGETAEVEALVRWHHSVQGPLVAGQFLQEAEDLGLMPAIGDWALQEVCRHLRAWRSQGLTLRVALNVSAAQLRAARFVTGIELFLARSGAEPSSLMFEITESSLLHEPLRSAAVLKNLRALGLHVALDNFGAAHLTLSHLESFSLDGVNIAQSVVRDMASNSKEGSPLGALIEAAAERELRVLGAGIQSEAQCEYLRGERCAQGQGFYFARPLPAGDLLRVLVAPALFTLGEAYPAQHLVGGGQVIPLEMAESCAPKKGRRRRAPALAPPIRGPRTERDLYTPSMAHSGGQGKLRLGASRPAL